MYKYWIALFCFNLAVSVQMGILEVLVTQFNKGKGSGKKSLILSWV